jgi:hypothetical protein
MTFEELYKHELEQRERVRAALGTPMGLLVVVGGLLGIMLQSFWFEARLLCYFFWLAALGSSFSFVTAMYFLVRSYHGHVYKTMPLALEQRNYRDQLREWHTKFGNGPADGDREYEAYLERLYAEAADHNARVNDAKSAFLYRANTSIVYFVILTVATFVPYAAHRALVPPVAQKIEIVDQSKGRSGDDNAERETSAKASPNPTQAPGTAAKGSSGGADS